MVPTTAVAQVGLRRVMSPREADTVLDTMKKREVAVDLQPWSRRFRAYTEMIKSGSPHEIAKVLRDMHRLKFDKELSFGERRLLDQAKALLFKELAFIEEATKRTLPRRWPPSSRADPVRSRFHATPRSILSMGWTWGAKSARPRSPEKRRGNDGTISGNVCSTSDALGYAPGRVTRDALDRLYRAGHCPALCAGPVRRRRRGLPCDGSVPPRGGAGLSRARCLPRRAGAGGDRAGDLQHGDARGSVGASLPRGAGARPPARRARRLRRRRAPGARRPSPRTERRPPSGARRMRAEGGVSARETVDALRVRSAGKTRPASYRRSRAGV